jgi:sporulation protein YlmC with PRC-barrel domain
MRLSEILFAKVKTLDGDTLGRVHEVHCDGGRVIALMCGPASWMERFTARAHGRRIPWECVTTIGSKQIFVAPDPPQRRAARKPTAFHGRRRAGRASALRSGH